MSVLVLVEFHVKPDHGDDVLSFLKSIIHDTRAFDGCNGLTCHRNQEDPNTMVLVEHWDSRQHYEKYLAWRTERGDLGRVTGWVEGDPSIRFFDIVGV